MIPETCIAVNHYDIVILGAGPAGSLASQEVDVVIKGREQARRVVQRIADRAE